VGEWDGKERRQPGRAEELRERIKQLQREWNEKRLPPKARAQEPMPAKAPARRQAK
jgi:hypothetical protein